MLPKIHEGAWGWDEMIYICFTWATKVKPDPDACQIFATSAPASSPRLEFQTGNVAEGIYSF